MASHHPAKNIAGTTSTISVANLRAEFAHHDPTVARINNGSFGSCPTSVLAAQQHYQHLFLRQPDDFYFNSLQPSIIRSRLLVKDLINADDVSEISLVDNVTTAAAIVLHHLSWWFMEGKFQKGDAVIMLNHSYNAVKKSVRAYLSRAGGTVIEADLPFPATSDSDIIQKFKETLDLAVSDGRKVRLAVIDHITSMPAMLIPVKELTRVCREKGVDHVFVDGAHAIGSVNVDVRDIGADFYTSNLHKWFFCPPTVAVLYCQGSPEAIHHPIVSGEYGKGIAVESGWVGTRDYSAQLVVPDVVKFVQRFEGGMEGVMRRNHEKVVEMGMMLAEAWGTGLGAPPEMCASMVMVGLPRGLGVESEIDVDKLRRILREEFGVEVHMYINGGDQAEVKAYVRISHHVYNVKGDYYRLRDAIDMLVKDGIRFGMVRRCDELGGQFGSLSILGDQENSSN